MEGYAQLAWRMSVHGDLAVVRRFAALNIQNILCLQAELVHLEERLREKERANSSSENETLRWYARDWQTLSRGQSHEGEDESQWRLCLRVRERLREYGTATRHLTYEPDLLQMSCLPIKH
jgi:hypothetical protein